MPTGPKVSSRFSGSYERAPTPAPDPTDPNTPSSRLGKPPTADAPLSAPVWPIMADPAWIFDHASDGSEESGAAPRIGLLKRLAQISEQSARSEATRKPDTRQGGQDGPGESSGPKEQGTLARKTLSAGDPSEATQRSSRKMNFMMS